MSSHVTVLTLVFLAVLAIDRVYKRAADASASATPIKVTVKVITKLTVIVTGNLSATVISKETTDETSKFTIVLTDWPQS